MVSVLLSASVKKFSVSSMLEFYSIVLIRDIWSLQKNTSLVIKFFSSLLDVPDASFGVSHCFLFVLVRTLIREESIYL